MTIFLEWCVHQFRGWSLIHFVLDAALTGILAIVLEQLTMFSCWAIVAICVLSCVVVACLISMAVRHREVREEEKHRVRDNVVGHLRTLAKQLNLPTASPEAIRQWSEVASHAVESRLNRQLSVEFADLLQDVEKRTDATVMALKAVDYLNSICDRLHYSDIKRLPAGD